MKFQSKLGITLISIMMTGFMIVSYLYLSTTVRIMRGELDLRFQETAQSAMNQLERFMFERLQDTKLMASILPFREESLDLKKITRRFIDYRNNWRTYVSIRFYDLSGKKLIDTSGLLLETDQKDRFFYKEALEKGLSSGVEVGISDAEKIPVIYFACVVKGKGGRDIGVVVALVPLHKLQYLVAETIGVLNGEKPFTIDLIDKEGRILYSSRKDVRILIDRFTDEAIKKQSMKGKTSGVTDVEMHRGGERHFHSFSIEQGFLDYKGNDWSVVLQIPETYLLSLMKELRIKMLEAFVVGLFGIAVIAWVLSGQISRPLVGLSRVAEKIGKGDLSVEIDYQGKDEFGQLADTFRAMLVGLREARMSLEGYSTVLEERIRERTAKLEESVRLVRETQEVTLSVLEDTHEAKASLEKSNAELIKAKEELSTFARDLEEKVKGRTRELSILYELSNSISYMLDYQTLMMLIMEALKDVVDYDFCASLLMDADMLTITLKPVHEGCVKFSDSVQKDLIRSVESSVGESVGEKEIHAFIIPTSPEALRADESRYEAIHGSNSVDTSPHPIGYKPCKHDNERMGTGAPAPDSKGSSMELQKNFDKLRSVLNVPFIVRGKIVGMMNISSCEKNAFGDEHAKLVRTILNQTSNAIERLQSVLSVEKSRMESMVESMTQGVIMIDWRGEISVINPRAKELLSFEKSKHVTSRMLIEKMNEIGLYDAFQEFQNKKSQITKEIDVHQTQKDMILRADITPVNDEHGKAIGFVTILRDITREKEIDKMKTEFISTVSHELRTPLSITREGLALVLDRLVGPINQEQEELLVTARNNIDRLAGIINDLLDISKIEAGKMELNLVESNLTEVIRQVMASFEIKTKLKGLGLKLKAPKEDVYIYVDANMMVQVLTNLIGNAIKFSEKGDIVISVFNKDEDIELRVIDEGRGILKEDLQNVFGKFQQFERIVGGGEKGTGLGLSIVKGIVVLHQGRIEVESEYGRGTIFTIHLPKLTSDMIVRQYVNEGIRKAVHKNLKMSLIIISFAGFDEMKRKLSHKELESIFKGMEKIAKETLRREGDMVYKGMGGNMIILVNCNKESALRIEVRLRQSFEDYFARKNLSVDYHLQLGCSTYPDDSKEADALVRKAKNI